MPEQDDNATATQTKEVKQPIKLGAVERFTMNVPKEGVDGEAERTNVQTNQQNNEGADATNDATKAVGDGKATAAPTITDEALAAFFKEKGIEYEGIDKLKEKLTAPAQTTAIADTPEQIKAKELAKEKRILDKFISGGGTAEQYVALKSLAEAPVEELSKNMLIKELKDAKFSDKEIEALIKERYYQLDDEELEQLDDETDKEFKKRSKEYFANKLANRSSYLKDKAVGHLKGIQDAINSEDLQAQQEVALSAKIDEDFKVFPRKMNIEIGEIGGKTVSPVGYDVSEEDIDSVRAVLKDPAKRQQLLFNQDGSLNTTKLAEVFVKAKAFDSAAKISYLEAQTRNNAIWKEKFGSRTPQELGVGGSAAKPIDKKGTAASFGKTERVKNVPQNT